MKAAISSASKETRVELLPLSLLRAGQAGRVVEVLGRVDLVQRLREMGLYDGAQVQMVRPGNPCIVRLLGQRLGFRTDDLARVMVCVTTTTF
jgi:ferrous iron transport protein A